MMATLSGNRQEIVKREFLEAVMPPNYAYIPLATTTEGLDPPPGAVMMYQGIPVCREDETVEGWSYRRVRDVIPWLNATRLLSVFIDPTVGVNPPSGVSRGNAHHYADADLVRCARQSCRTVFVYQTPESWRRQGLEPDEYWALMNEKVFAPACDLYGAYLDLGTIGIWAIEFAGSMSIDAHLLADVARQVGVPEGGREPRLYHADKPHPGYPFEYVPADW